MTLLRGTRRAVIQQMVKFPTLERYLQRTPGLVALWPLQEESGAYAYDRSLGSLAYPGVEVIVNGEFTADTDWTKGDAAITIASGKATWSGAQAGNADLTAAVAPLTNAVRYVISFTVSGYSAGTITPLFGTQAGTARSANGTFSEEVIANGAAFVLRGNLDFAGNVEVVSVKTANPLNGTYSNVTLGQVATGTRLGYAGSFNGTSSYVNVYSAALNSAFNRQAGTIGIFGQIAAASWVDGLRKRLIAVRADGSNELFIDKSTVNNTMVFYYTSSGGVLQHNIITSNTEYMLLMLTWDVLANKFNSYINSVLQSTSTGVVAWVGGLASNRCTIGHATLGSLQFLGEAAYGMCYNRALAPAEIAAITRVGGVT